MCGEDPLDRSITLSPGSQKHPFIFFISYISPLRCCKYLWIRYKKYYNATVVCIGQYNIPLLWFLQSGCGDIVKELMWIFDISYVTRNNMSLLLCTSVCNAIHFYDCSDIHIRLFHQHLTGQFISCIHHCHIPTLDLGSARSHKLYLSSLSLALPYQHLTGQCKES